MTADQEDAGELLTLQRAAHVTEAEAHADPFLPPLTESLDALRCSSGPSRCETGHY